MSLEPWSAVSDKMSLESHLYLQNEMEPSELTRDKIGERWMKEDELGAIGIEQYGLGR